MQPKPWYQSTIIWASVVLIALMAAWVALLIAGVSVPGEIPAAFGMALSIVTIYLRASRPNPPIGPAVDPQNTLSDTQDAPPAA